MCKTDGPKTVQFGIKSEPPGMRGAVPACNVGLSNSLFKNRLSANANEPKMDNNERKANFFIKEILPTALCDENFKKYSITKEIFPFLLQEK